MKSKRLKLIASFIIMIVVSCDEPETVVTNYVHPDGSVTRRIEIRNHDRKFKASDLQVPFDSTWTVKDSCEISDKEDTIWVKRAEKLFRNADEINLAYKNDSGANKAISRRVLFKKTFKWFNTEYRFEEQIDKKLEYGYPAKDFLNNEELSYFYSPEELKQAKENGADSTRFKELRDSVNHKTEIWGYKNLVSEWIGDFAELTKGKAGKDMTRDFLKSREDEIVRIVAANEKNLDSLWTNGILLKQFLGEENALKYKTESDTAGEYAAKKFFVDFKEYSVRIVMPGQVISTNGFIDSTKVLLWPVKSDYFLAEPYVMWAESKKPNIWAWIISGLFLAFVLTGLVLRKIKKG